MEEKTNTKRWLKISVIMMIFTMILSFSGCLRYKTTATVHKDGTVDVEILYAVIDSADSGSVDWDAIKSVSKIGWTVEEYYDNSDDYVYRGYTLSKDGIVLTDLADELIATNLGFEGFTLKQEDETYILNWDASSETSSASSSGGSSNSLESMDGYMKFILKVPGAVESDNATSRKGKTLEWDLIETPAPFCKFKLTGGGLPIWAIVLISVVVVGGIIALVVVLRNKKKNQFIPTYRTQEELDAMFRNEPARFPEDPMQWEAEQAQSPFARPVSVPQTMSEETEENFLSDESDYGTHTYDDDILKPEFNTPIWAKPLSEEERNALGRSDETER